MPGEWLRRVHVCEPPDNGNRGDVWQCFCGRRWTCSGGGWGRPCNWHRRVWPWPREVHPSPDQDGDS